MTIQMCHGQICQKMALRWIGVLVTVLVTALLKDNHFAEAYSSGNGIDGACPAMKPFHGPEGQTSKSPFAITFAPASYTPGTPVPVTIKACTSKAFKGFMIQARRATNGSNQDELLGSFTPVPNTQHQCSAKGLVHNNPNEKTTLTFNWNPPSKSEGPVQFRATFVHQKAEFWVAVKSAVLLDSSMTNTPDSTLTPPSTLAPECTVGHFTKDSDCDENKNCFGDCINDDCTFQVKFRKDGDNFGEYSIKTRALGTSVYGAIGFSSDRAMGKDSVTACTYHEGSVKAINLYNNGHEQPEKLSSDGVSVVKSSYGDGIFSCTFKRAIAGGLDSKRYSLTMPWYLLFARGVYDDKDENIGYHFSAKAASLRRYSLIDDSIVTATTASPGVSYFSKDADCDESKNCFSDCGNAGCTFQVKLLQDGDDFGEYSIKTIAIGSSDMYAAIGFSSDQKMGEDSVSGCIYESGKNSKVFNAYNSGKSSPQMLASDGVTLKDSSHKDGIFSCTLKRAIAAGLDNKRFDLSKSWYLLFAKSKYTDNKLVYHKSDKQVSTKLYSLTGDSDAGTPPPTATNSPLDGSLSLPVECGSSKGCISKCSGSSCETVISWEDDSNDSTYVLYTLTSVVSSPSFVAIGFSSDKEMGGDSVSGCATGSDNSIKVFSARNTGKTTPTQYDDPDVTLVDSKLDGNELTCTIKRLKSASADAKRVDITKKWYILFVRAPSEISGQKVTLNFHGDNYIISPEKFSSDDRPNVGGANIDYPLVKAHGSVMIAAWLFLASIGIIAARYYKPVWKSDLFSQKVWFQIHRTCMILVFCSTATGFVLIFVEVEGWSDLLEEHAYLETHPVLGVIVTGLTVLNPVMAFFRPHPGTEKRFIFNWAHWFVGTAAYILGVITIFFGVQLRKAQAPDSLVYILAGYAAWQVLVTLILELMQCRSREKGRQEVYELDDMQGKKTGSVSETSKTITIKRVILIVHVIVLAAISSVLIGFVCVGEEDL